MPTEHGCCRRSAATGGSAAQFLTGNLALLGTGSRGYDPAWSGLVCTARLGSAGRFSSTHGAASFDRSSLSHRPRRQSGPVRAVVTHSVSPRDVPLHPTAPSRAAPSRVAPSRARRPVLSVARRGGGARTGRQQRAAAAAGEQEEPEPDKVAADGRRCGGGWPCRKPVRPVTPSASRLTHP